MTTIRAVLARGFHSVTRAAVLLPLYTWLLVLGFVQTWPLLLAGNELRNPFLRDLAAATPDTLVDLLLNNEAALGQLFGWLLLLLPMALLSGIGYAFWAGGALSVVLGARSFGVGARRYFLAFTALGILLLILVGVVIAIAIATAAATLPAVGLGIAITGMVLLNIVGEYARAVTVAHDRLNPLSALGLAFRFCARHIGGVLVLALVATLLAGLLTFAHRSIAGLFGASVWVVVWQQLVVLAGVWLKALRLAWAAHYVVAEAHPTAPEFPPNAQPV